MDYKKSTRLLEEVLGAVVSVSPTKLLIYKDCTELEVPYGLFPIALVVFMPKEKAWSAFKVLYGRDREAYEDYLKVPSRACWLSKAVARALAAALAGRALPDLEKEVERRWPNVCGTVDAFSEALKLVTSMNASGVSASFYKGDKEGEIRTEYCTIKVRKSDPVDERFLRELREIAQRDPELLKRVLIALCASESCGDLAEVVKLKEELLTYGFVRAKLREKAEELAKGLSLRLGAMK